MDEKTVVEEEVVEESETGEPEEKAPSQSAAQFSKVLDETAKLFESLGRALVATSQDLTNRIWVRADKDTRYHMDLLVESGATKSRAEAAAYLIDEGIKAKQPLFEKVERTQAQIASLKQQLRSMRGINATE